MKFSELKPGDKIIIHNGWNDFTDGSACLILSIDPIDPEHIINYSALTSSGIITSQFWIHSDVDRNKVFGEPDRHWDLIE